MITLDFIIIIVVILFTQQQGGRGQVQHLLPYSNFLQLLNIFIFLDVTQTTFLWAEHYLFIHTTPPRLFIHNFFVIISLSTYIFITLIIITILQHTGTPELDSSGPGTKG